MNFNEFDYETLVREIDAYTKEHVKQSRYEHSVRVALMCQQICKANGLDENKGYFVGISHDMCKDFSEEELIELASKDGVEINSCEQNNPKLLHGRAAAVLLKEKYNIYDEDILESIAYHTSGIMGMCDLSKVLFVADKIEPNRPQSTDEYRARLLGMPLAEMFNTVYIENYNYITMKGYQVYPGTQEMLECIKNSK